MDPQLIQTLGDELYTALRDRQVVEPLSSRHEGIGIEDAYRVQQRMIARRLDAGERIVGKKIGVTSRAVMNMLGVYQPDFGYLLDGPRRVVHAPRFGDERLRHPPGGGNQHLPRH